MEDIGLLLLPWDGSRLDDIHPKNVIERTKINNFIITTILLKDYHMLKCVTHTVRSESVDACICDELKPHFELRKTGTHWARFGGSKKLLVMYHPKSYLNCEPLPKEMIYAMTDEVRKILIFKYICQVSINSERHIILFNGQPTSIKEHKINLNEPQMNKLTIEKYFDIIPYSKIVAQMFNINPKYHDNEYIWNLRNELETKMNIIFNRVNKDLINYKYHILKNVYDTLINYLSSYSILKLEEENDDYPYVFNFERLLNDLKK